MILSEKTSRYQETDTDDFISLLSLVCVKSRVSKINELRSFMQKYTVKWLLPLLWSRISHARLNEFLEKVKYVSL